MTDEEVDKNGYNFDVHIVLLSVLLLGVVLQTNILPRPIEILIIGFALAYIVLLSLMFILSGMGLINYVYRKHKRG